MSLDHLLSPLELGPVTLRNRIVSTSHQTSLVEHELPTDDLVAYQEARAAGGAGLLSVEASSPDPSGQLSEHQIAAFRPEVVPALARIADAVHSHDARLFIQFCHGGREQITAGYRAPAVAPTAIPSLRYHSEARALTTTEIAEIVEGHRVSARHAREAGLDGVECLAAYNYLPGQFLSPRANLRSDGYGGNLEGRMRFLVEILEAMRDGVGDGRAVGLRLTAANVDGDGLNTEEAMEVFAALRGMGLVDYLSTSIGDSSTYAGSTWIAPPAPLASEEVASLAAQVREISGLPVIATTRVTDPRVADAMIASGEADAVGMTRAMIADPQLAAKATEGRLEEIEACTGCNQACIGHYHAGAPINCAINPWAGRERTLPRPVTSSRRIVIVGGGPAGCAAVRAAPGAHVTLFESEAMLGGQWRLALPGPSHVQIAEATLATMERWVDGAELRLGSEATVEEIVALEPDLVVLASGARPYRPPLVVGAEAPLLLDAWELLAGAPVADGPVLVWDWGGDWTGFIAAEALATAGHQVKLAGGSAAFGEGMHQYQRNLYLARLDELGVALIPHVRPVRLADGAIEVENVFSTAASAIPDVETLLTCAGRTPYSPLYEPMVTAGLDVRRAGDCLSARTTEEAVHEGTVAALVG